MDKLVFVYGTLKSGHGNHVLLDNAELIGTCITDDDYLLTTVGFPYLIPEDALRATERGHTAPVIGEVYRVTEEQTMASLDSLEGVRYNHYKHRTIGVKSLDKQQAYEVTAYVPCDAEDAAAYPLCPQKEINGTTCYIY
jgi:gamma-glutamylcyclotransferase (GGCT)/AIG2-like uncharacterized protein YtfP